MTAFDAVAHTKPLQTLHTMGVLLNSLPLPHTNHEWAQAQAAAEALAEKWKIKRSMCHWPWLWRTYIFAEMCHHGVKALKIVRDWDSQELQEALRLDQNEWLTSWMSYLAGNSLKKLLRRLRFTESLEMSVFACIMNDSAVMKIPLDQGACR